MSFATTSCCPSCMEQRRLMAWRPAATVLSTQRSDSQRRHRPQPGQGVGRECRRVRHGVESSRLGAAQEVMRSGSQATNLSSSTHIHVGCKQDQTKDKASNKPDWSAGRDMRMLALTYTRATGQRIYWGWREASKEGSPIFQAIQTCPRCLWITLCVSEAACRRPGVGRQSIQIAHLLGAFRCCVRVEGGEHRNLQVQYHRAEKKWAD
jgi:hypothetical protein